MSAGELYPRCYYDDLSPTWFHWNKLTAHDILTHIRSEAGFEGQDIWFWQNHPICYFQLMGLVVQIDSVANGKYSLLTIDDGSGVNLEAKIERKAARRDGEAEWKENSLTENVDVFVEMSLPVVLLDGKKVELGEIMQVKGTLTTFRQERQLVVKRLRRVKDTNEEVLWWSQMADWKRQVLSVPWVITEEEKAHVDEKQEKKERELKRTRKQNLRRAQRQKEGEERREAKRSLQEEEMNMHALEGSNTVPEPWN